MLEETQDEMRTRQEALVAAEQRRLTDAAEERRRKDDEETRQATIRMERVKEIDRLISEGQACLQDLVCEKDVLQQQLNALFDYTSESVEVILDDDTDVANIEMQGATRTNSTFRIEASKKFKLRLSDFIKTKFSNDTIYHIGLSGWIQYSSLASGQLNFRPPFGPPQEMWATTSSSWINGTSRLWVVTCLELKLPTSWQE